MDNEKTGYELAGMANIKTERIPAELKALPHWVAWKAVERGDGKKPTKIPINPATGGNAQSDNPSTWGSFDAAVRRATADSLAGIGLMFGGDDDLVGVDLDDVWDQTTGKFANPLAEPFVRGLDTYTEVSPSGRGVKLWLRSSTKPAKCNGTISYADKVVGYETYCRRRWFAVTGHVLPQYGSGAVQERTAKYSKMLELGAKTKASGKKGEAGNGAGIPPPSDGIVADEEAMLRAALSKIDPGTEPTWFRIGCCLKSWGAADGTGDRRARRLWDEWSKQSGKYDEDDQSRRWERMRPDGGLTIGTVFAEAMDAGYEMGDAVGGDGKRYRADRTRANSSGDKPVVELPNIGGWSRTTITAAAGTIGRLMGGSAAVYCRGGVVVKVRDGESVEVSPSEMQSEVERHAALVIAKVNAEGKVRTVSTTATATQCQAVMASLAFLERIPHIRTMTTCPVITRRGDGTVAVVTGYDRESGILATGGSAEDVPLADAVALLKDSIADFDFATPGDRSRALAAMVTPALVQGGLLGGRAPIDLGEADDSQAGKGYRNRMISAIYNSEVNTIAQRQGGSGSLEESFCRALMAGASFISIDNVRRKIDSPMIESALTEDYCDCRVPYRQPMQVDMRRVCVMMTTNGVSLNRDLANRCSPVRIRKREGGYAYRKYPEGDLLAHVRACQGRYLGAVLAVVKAWHAAGMPSTGETRHDFRRWAGVLDWIVVRVFGEAPLCDGLAESKARMTNPHLSWVREIALAVIRKGLAGQELRTGTLVDVAEESGIEIGDTSAAPDPDKAAGLLVGKKLGRAFSLSPDGKVLQVDDTMRVERKEEQNPDGHPRKSYIFSMARTPTERQGKEDAPPDRVIAGVASRGDQGNEPSNTTMDTGTMVEGRTDSLSPRDRPPDGRLMGRVENPNVPLDPSDGGQHLLHYKNSSAGNTLSHCSVIAIGEKMGGHQADQADHAVSGTRDSGQKGHRIPTAIHESHTFQPPIFEVDTAGMSVEEVVAGVRAGRIYWAKLIDMPGYDIVSAWREQSHGDRDRVLRIVPLGDAEGASGHPPPPDDDPSFLADAAEDWGGVNSDN